MYVSDQKESTTFFSEILRSEPVLNVPGMTEFMINPFTKLGLMPENGIARILQDKTPHPATGNGIPRAELYLFVEDPNESYRNALIHGAKEISGVSERDWGHLAGYVADRDGHIIAFAKES